MKQVKTSSGITGYQCRLKDNYSSLEEFEAYSNTFNLTEKLGFNSPAEAWEANPLIEASCNPEDFRRVKERLSVVVFDNGGETLDRYTILNKKTGDLIGASENPTNPQGFGQYCGNVVDNYMYITFGYSWRKYCNVNATIKDEVKRYLSDCKHIGKKIAFKALPPEVQNFVTNYFND
jgi:hypothetical protein